MQESYDDRLASARDEAQSPWQLAFVLTGGWRRIRGDMAQLRDSDQSDLVVVLIAVVELLLRGGGVPRPDLEQLAQAMGRGPRWLDKALAEAEQRRLVIAGSDGWRLPHLRFAEVVLALTLGASTQPQLLAAVAAAVDSERFELAGVHWLLDVLVLSAHGTWLRSSLLDESVAQRLVDRCWAAPEDRHGPAAFVLSDVRRLSPRQVNLAGHAEALGRWISTADPVAMPGLSRLVNDTINDDRERPAGEPRRLEAICAQIDADQLVARFLESRWPDAYFFGELLNRLGFGPKDFRDRIAARLDPEAVRALFGSWPETKDADLTDLAKALMGVGAFDYEMALDLIEELTPGIAHYWQSHFGADRGFEMDLLFMLGFGPMFLRGRQPSRRQRLIARRLCEATDPARVAAAISSSGPRQWQQIGLEFSFMKEASLRHARRVARLIDFGHLDSTTAGLWSGRFGELTDLLLALALKGDAEPAASWLARHLAAMPTVGVLAAAIAPAASVRRLNELDAVLELNSPGHAWSVSGMALFGIAREDVELARRSIAHSRSALAAAFAEAFEFHQAEPFIVLLQSLASDELAAAVAEVDPARARDRWSEILRGEKTARGRKAAERRAVAELVELALGTDAPITQVAAELRRIFPAASRPTRLPA